MTSWSFGAAVAFGCALTMTLTACGTAPRTAGEPPPDGEPGQDGGAIDDGGPQGEDPPGETPDGEDPAIEDPPGEDPPAEDPPAEDPEAEDPPADDPGGDEPPADEPAPPDEAAADEVAAWLTGRFDSSAQALRDPNYFSVGLSVCPVRVPALGERVLYVEQALVDRPRAPYRQRLYVVEALEGGQVASHVYTLANEADAVGLCDLDQSAEFRPQTPAIRRGCTVTLQRQGDAWVGGTDGLDCASSLQGASYATSEVTLGADRVLSWDRGYDASGAQVWGAVAGPYEFLRVEPEEEVDDPVGPPVDDPQPAAAGETCEDAPDLERVSAPLPEAVGPLTHLVEAAFGASNDYNPYQDAGLAPGCSLVFDAMGNEVVFAVDLEPGAVLHTLLTMDSPDAAGGLYVLDDCAEGSWPDHDDSGMCGRNEYRSHGNCVWADCEPLDWEFSWPADAPAPARVFLVVDQVAGDDAESFTLQWGIVAPE